MNTIFVQIASYRDPQLLPTLLDAIAKSLIPTNLRFVVCWQHGTEEDIKDFLDIGFNYIEQKQSDLLKIHILSMNGAIVELIDTNYFYSQGCGWARKMINGQYKDEKYTSQLDSHHRFIACWDEYLIQALDKLLIETTKPVLTGYVPGFVPCAHLDIYLSHMPMQTNFNKFAYPSYVSLRGAPLSLSKRKIGAPIRARFLTGGFLFSYANFLQEVPYDDRIFFSGEEIMLSVRAFTWGYDFFHPNDVVLWHQYKRRNTPHIWDDHDDSAKEKLLIDFTATERAKRSFQYVFDVLNYRSCKEDGLFGMIRSIEDYEIYAGLNFRERTATREALSGVEPTSVRINDAHNSPRYYRSDVVISLAVLDSLIIDDLVRIDVNILSTNKIIASFELTEDINCNDAPADVDKIVNLLVETDSNLRPTEYTLTLVCKNSQVNLGSFPLVDAVTHGLIAYE